MIAAARTPSLGLYLIHRWENPDSGRDKNKESEEILTLNTTATVNSNYSLTASQINKNPHSKDLHLP